MTIIILLCLAAAFLLLTAFISWIHRQNNKMYEIMTPQEREKHDESWRRNSGDW